MDDYLKKFRKFEEAYVPDMTLEEMRKIRIKNFGRIKSEMFQPDLIKSREALNPTETENGAKSEET